MAEGIRLAGKLHIILAETLKYQSAQDCIDDCNIEGFNSPPCDKRSINQSGPVKLTLKWKLKIKSM